MFVNLTKNVVVKKIWKMLKKKIYLYYKQNQWYECCVAVSIEKKLSKNQFFQSKKTICIKFVCCLQFEFWIHLHVNQIIWFATRCSNFYFYQIQSTIARFFFVEEIFFWWFNLYQYKSHDHLVQNFEKKSINQQTF